MICIYDMIHDMNIHIYIVIQVVYVYIYIYIYIYKSFLPTYLWFSLQASIAQKIT